MRHFDLFPKVSDESFGIKTRIGGLISLLTFFSMGIVVFVEIKGFRDVKYVQQAYVEEVDDKISSFTDLSLSMDIAYPCQLINVKVLDFKGSHEVTYKSNLMRQRLDFHRKPIENPINDNDTNSLLQYCGSCLGSNYSKCCRTCFDISTSFIRQDMLVPNLDNAEQCIRDKKSINDREMCRITGVISLPSDRGVVLFDAGGELERETHVKNDMSYFGDNVNLSHWIDEFRFGPYVPHLKNPLKNNYFLQPNRGFFVQKYTLNLVSTLDETETRTKRATQFSATFSMKEIKKVVSKKHPHLSFIYRTAPISVRLYKSSKTLTQLLTNICAIVGGGFTIGSLIDSFLFKINSIKND